MRSRFSGSFSKRIRRIFEIRLNDKASGRKLTDDWVDHLLPAEFPIRAFAAGKVREFSGWEKKLELQKSITFSQPGRTLQFTHRIRNRTSKPLCFRYGTEFTWKLKDAHVNRIGETPALKRFSIVDPAAHLEVRWEFSRPARLMYFPRETKLSGTGNRPGRVYQGVSVTPSWKVSLPARGGWSVRWTLTLGEAHAVA